MKNKVLTIILSLAMICSLSACGSSKDEAVTASATEETDATEEAKEEKPEKAASEERNAYGLTEEEQEQLLASVKESITTNYLEKYAIDPASFTLLPYDPQEFANYDDYGNYTGTDPHECSSMWDVVHSTICDGFESTRYLIEFSSSDDTESALESILEMSTDNDDFPVFEETLEAQNNKNLESVGYGPVLDTWTTQHYDFANAMYMGIADFLNGLSDEERVTVLVYMFEQYVYHKDEVIVDGYGYDSQTMFDRVISENIQFQ